jgi:hypothetical protein
MAEVSVCLFIICAAYPPPPPYVPGTTSLRQWMQAWATFAKQCIRRRRLVTKSTRAGNRLLLRRAFDEWKRVRSYTRRVARAASQRARCVGGVAQGHGEASPRLVSIRLVSIHRIVCSFAMLSLFRFVPTIVLNYLRVFRQIAFHA